MGPPAAKDHPWEYLTASALAASINYPLWRASATAQSGFAMHTVTLHPSVTLPESVAHFVHAFRPPYKGMVPTVLGMTWARAAIFWTSDTGREWLLERQVDPATATVVPPLVTSTVVQIVNMPLVRATITIQDPNSTLPNVRSALLHIWKNHGYRGLWHGTWAGILKTVPKYITAIAVKDYMEGALPRADPNDRSAVLWRSALKSATAGVAGAVCTNPLDVIRNKMFQTNRGMMYTIDTLQRQDAWRWLYKGMGKNMVAVAIPVGCTIFFTDMLLQMNH